MTAQGKFRSLPQLEYAEPYANPDDVLGRAREQAMIGVSCGM